MPPFRKIILGLVIGFSFSHAAEAEPYFGNYCSLAMHDGAWGTLIDPYLRPSELCQRVQSDFLNGARPAYRQIGSYSLYGMNRVFVSCRGSFPIDYEKVGIGDSPFYQAVEYAQNRNLRGCVLTAD